MKLAFRQPCVAMISAKSVVDGYTESVLNIICTVNVYFVCSVTRILEKQNFKKVHNCHELLA